MADVQPAEVHKGRGFLSVSALHACRRINDIAETFSVPVASVQLGFRRKGAIIWTKTNQLLWWPRERCMTSVHGKKTWYNDFFAGDTEIRETCADASRLHQHIADLNSGYNQRVVFKCHPEPNYGYCYRYIGIFDYDAAATRAALGAYVVWKRVNMADKLML